MKATIKNLFQLAGLQTSKNGHLCTYTVEPESNEIVFFYVGAWADDTQQKNAFIAFHGLPDGSTTPSISELESALKNWLKTHKAQPYDISKVYERMRCELEINKRLGQGETIKDIINSLNK
jgi:hypothetical protein